MKSIFNFKHFFCRLGLMVGFVALTVGGAFAHPGHGPVDDAELAVAHYMLDPFHRGGQVFWSALLLVAGMFAARRAVALMAPRKLLAIRESVR